VVFEVHPKPKQWDAYLGNAKMLRPELEQTLGWDAFDVVVLTPGDLMLLISWKTQSYTQEFEKAVKLPLDESIRRVRVVRDYGMFDRREAPRSYPDTVRATA
jgi:hypothetical protein